MESHLKQIRRQLGLNQEDMAKILNCSKSNISMIETGKSSLTERNKRWLVQFLNINPLWLDGEKVPMIAPGAEDRKSTPETAEAAPENVPVYDMDKLPGLVQLFRKNHSFKPSGHISIPGLPRCDGAVRIVGDSMNPVLRSGDMVLYRQLSGPAEIFWGDMYLISVGTSTEDRILVRYLRKSKHDGKVILAAENPLFGEQEIKLSEIRALAFVKASIRMNSSK